MAKAGRKPHQPTDETRELVKMHAMVGTTQDTVAKMLGIAEKTLRLHYRDELDFGLASVNADVGGALYRKAMDGDTAAMIFWLKTRARWSERQEIDHMSSDGTMTPTKIQIVGPNDDG